MILKSIQIGDNIYHEGSPYPIKITSKECPKCQKRLLHDTFCEAIDLKTRKLTGLFQCSCGFEKIMEIQ